ncbi:F-box protein CPR30 [Spatholobus suberectus]|nr:F-box protein CPR30 [Spatholobus suberectus]
MKRNAPLPDELIEAILLRLPVRCLLRLKCVCKSWLSLISDPQFAESHFALAAAPTHRLLLKNFSNDSVANSVDTDAPLDDDSADVVFNIPNPLPAPIRKHGRSRRVDVAGSCRGFILLTTASPDFIYFVIWNPSIGIQKRFSRVSPKLSYRCGIGYDSSTDDYVVVTLTFLPRRRGAEVHCFSSRTNSWSCIEGAVPYLELGDEFGHGLFLNGALHWLVYSYDDKHSKIIAFDVTERRLSEIPLPHGLEASPYLYHLRVMEGCLCLCCALRNCTAVLTEIWMMKEYKVQSSWTESFVFFTHSYPFHRFFPICFTKNGEILGHDCGKILVRLNDRRELLNYRELPEHRALELFNHRYGSLHRGIYRESLLSLPRN